MAIEAPTDRRRLRGQRTRQAILLHAARVGSAEGLEAVVCGLEKGGSDFAPMERFRMIWPDAGGETAVVDEDSRVLVGR